MENLVSEELKQLGVSDIKNSPGSVGFSATMEQAYEVCLWSRLANRILFPLKTFPAETPEALYAGVKAIDWLEHFSPEETLAIDTNVTRSKLNNSHYVALQVKDAIVDQLRDKTGERPTIDIRHADIRLNVYINRDQAQIALDLSGGSLHQRGYRIEGATAPLKENLAASILTRAGWAKIAGNGGSFCDFMCGSGTLLIEAAMIAGDIAPGLQREHFGFLRWKKFDAPVWEKLMQQAHQRRLEGQERIPKIIGFDQSFKAFKAASQNIRSAGLEDFIHLEKQELSQISINKKLPPGLVCSNPPYGKRIGDVENLGGLYREIGTQLKNHFLGWQAAIFTANPELGKTIPLHSHKQYSFFNGPLKCKLLLIDVKAENFITPKRLPRLIASEELGEHAQMFLNRLRKNRKHLSKWLRQSDVHCYRLYDADIPEYAVAVDIYEADPVRIHVQEYEAPKDIDQKTARFRIREVLSALRDEFEVNEEQLFFKQRRQQKGSQQYEKQSDQSEFFSVKENGLLFKVNMEQYLDTGLFLDHREARQWVREKAQGKDFLNLFAYTGSATVYAAAGGAKSTTTVDMSRTYLNWAEDNMQLNKLSGEQHEFEQADCIAWLKQQGPYPRFDLIFLDPPSFSNSKRMKDVFDIQRDHVSLIKNSMRILRPGGLLIFSNNLRNFKIDREELSQYELKDMTKPSIPKDFERNAKIHQCWFITQK